MNDPKTALTKTTAERERIERSLSRLDRLAKLMDDQFELPVVKYRIGLDPLLGLIPGGGDWVTWIVSLYVLFEALLLRVPLKVLVGIGATVTTDLVLGYAPGVGDLADVVFKANRRSVRIVTEYFEGQKDPRAPERVKIPETALQKPRSGPERWIVGIFLVALFTALAAVPIVLLWWLLRGGS